MASVRIVDIRKSLGGSPILKGIRLDINDGELLVLVGPSGCGKSTLLRTLAGLEVPDEGQIWIGDRRVDQWEPRERNIAMVFQSYALYPHMTVRANLAFSLRLRRQKEEQVAGRVAEISQMLGISDLLNRFPSQLSGGQRQRVAMGRALVRDADVFLLDEPLSNLDAALRTQTRVEIKRVHSRLGSTMVYVTHDQVEAMTLADRLVVLRAGEIMQVGTPAELYDRPANSFVATFLGSPPMNLLRCRVDGSHLRSKGVDLPCPRSVGDRAEVIVGLRPHDFVIDSADPRQAGSADGIGMEGTVCGLVDAIEPLGWDANVHVRGSFEKIVARVDAPTARRLSEGQELTLRLPRSAVHIFDAQTELALGHGE